MYNTTVGQRTKERESENRGLRQVSNEETVDFDTAVDGGV